jgi:hypothetical protein
VLRNAGAARPRQTDLFARDDDRAYLIEAKWRKTPATVADVDALRARLDATLAHVVGVLVSVSGFSATAIERVETVRDRPVVLLDEDDVEMILGGIDLARLLRRKEAWLLIHGRVRPGHSKRLRRSDPPVRRDQYLADTDGERVPWTVSRGGFAAPAFSVELFDIDWVPAGGAGVTLDIPVTVASRAQLQDLLVTLVELGWSSRAGQWTLRQSESVWYGIGQSSLRRSLADQQARYRKAGPIHHTEQLVLADVCPGGWFTLTADLAARSQHVYATFLSAQLIGVPVDLRPLMRLCDRLDVDRELFFRPRNQPSVETRHLDRSSQPVELDVRGWVIDADPIIPEPSNGRGASSRRIRSGERTRTRCGSRMPSRGRCGTSSSSCATCVTGTR